MGSEVMKRFRSMLLSVSDIFIFSIILFLKVISLNYGLKLVDHQDKQLMLGCLGSVLLIAALLSIFDIKKRVKLLIAADAIISLILMADLVYNRYFYDVTSVALLKQVKLVGEVKDSVKALIRPRDFVYFIDLLVLIPLYNKFKVKINSFSGRLTIKFRAAMLTMLLILGYSFSYNSVLALQRDQPDILKTFYDKKYIVKKIGGLNFHIFDFYRYISNDVLNKNKIGEEEKNEINQWFGEKESAKVKKYDGVMEGKNLIVVQLEAFQGFVLNKSINGQEITPNLNRLAKESLVFDNYFYQTAWGGTSDAEFLTQNSLLPAREGAAYYQYAGNTYDSMVQQFKNKGYYTSVMHANRPGFWNRTNMYMSLGFDKYESEKDYAIDDTQGLGLSDKSFFKQSVDKIEEYKSPFYSFMISLSSHFPFKDQDDKIKDILDVGEFEGQLMGDYLKSVRYTDEAIGELIENLKKEGIWDNSVVVFYGDHSAIPFEKRDQIARLLYSKNDLTPLEWFEAQKVVAIAHFPEGKIKGHKSITGGQMDMYPTLSNVFGLEAKYALGRDLLNNKDGFIVLRDGTWANNNVVYLKSIDKVVDRKTGKELNNDDYISEFEMAYNYLRHSDAVIENNLIKGFKSNEK